MIDNLNGDASISITETNLDLKREKKVEHDQGYSSTCRKVSAVQQLRACEWSTEHDKLRANQHELQVGAIEITQTNTRQHSRSEILMGSSVRLHSDDGYEESRVS